MGYKFTDNVARFVGGLLLCVAGIWIVLCVIFVAIREEPGAMAGALMLTAIFGIPGFFLYRHGKKAGDEERKMEAVASLIRAYRRMPIADAARKLAWTEAEVERVFSLCVERGVLKGHVDRQTQELFTDEAVADEVHPKGGICPKCGAVVEGTLLKGEAASCPYCKSRL